MSGETNLDRLLKDLTVTLVEGVFVFVTLKNVELPVHIVPRMTFREAEGVTLIILKSEAEAFGIPFEFPCRMITLNIHSSLEAVGFIARIAMALARRDISVNPVSGFYHDHLFVPEGRVNEALEILQDLSNGQ